MSEPIVSIIMPCYNAARTIGESAASVLGQSLKELELDNYLFGVGAEALSAGEKEKIIKQLEHEIMDIFSCRNLPRS